MECKRFTPIALGVVLLAAACSNTEDIKSTDGGFSDGTKRCVSAEGDQDRDGIPNGEEGCLYGKDTDGDGIADWEDLDSDGDGIPDGVEAGKQGACLGKSDQWPCDSDGDGFPDYLDIDSDGDGLRDEDEDQNGDGLLGCCLTRCNAPESSAQSENCILNDDGCGAGQTCDDGTCTPPRDFRCSNGETDPLAKDTLGDGKLDRERGTFICRNATEDRPIGRKRLITRQSADGANTGDWHVALEEGAKYGDLRIANVRPKEAAAVIDHDDPESEVAGFVLSMPQRLADVHQELQNIISSLRKTPPGGAGGIISQRALGTVGRSHDLYTSVRGTFLDLEISGTSNVSMVRNELIASVLGRSAADFENLPGAFGGNHTNYVVRLVLVRRYAFATDTQGKIVFDENDRPKEDPKQLDKRRIVVMGAIAARGDYQDPKQKTGFIVDDLTNGTALAIASDKVEDECDVGTITDLPVADIIWVVDESGSMDDVRRNMVNNAKNFFSRALSSGLDFRMGITNVCRPGAGSACPQGKFCSDASIPDGGPDRFLVPSETAAFDACIFNPPGEEGGSEYGLQNARLAVTKHLPREDRADRIRPKAKLVVIIVTDEGPQSLASAIGTTIGSNCQLDPGSQVAVSRALKPYLDLFGGITDPQAAAQVHLIGFLCGSVCSNASQKSLAHGYLELAQALGGQVGDVCQRDLGSTLQAIIDSIVGAASPVQLDYVPIAASLAVAVDGRQIKRSRVAGFDYRVENNALAFIGVKLGKGSEVVASYKRWARQVIIQ